MKAIILAAGNGRRLYPYTQHVPKCLLDLGGLTILENQLTHIRDSGIDDVVIVVGYKSEKIEQFISNLGMLGMKIKTLFNPFYRTTNSLISLWIARDELDQDIIVMNSDDVFEFEVLERILDMNEQNICLPIKIKNSYEKEDMKIIIENNKIIDIGKDIKGQASAESVGIRLFRDRGVIFLKRAIEQEIRARDAVDKWYASAVLRLINMGYKTNYLDIEDLFWMDVDFHHDLYWARINSDKFIKTTQHKTELHIVETGS